AAGRRGAGSSRRAVAWSASWCPAATSAPPVWPSSSLASLQPVQADLEQRLLGGGDVLLAARQPPGPPGRQELVDRAVDDRRGKARVDVPSELASLDAPRDPPLDPLDRLPHQPDPPAA